MKVPFVDLKSQYQALRERIDAAIRAVIERTAFIRGPFAEAFEKAFAEKCGAKHCVTCANGTDAIYITLKALGIGPGDEVITVANTWISTSETITQAGARPVFVDTEPDSYLIDPGGIESKITSRTKAVIPVHLYGQMADVGAIGKICRERGLFLIEDCAQSHLATLRGRTAGTLGIAGTFSFYPGKNLGAYGDAGAIITDDGALAARALMFANHGSPRKHVHEMEGINSRMDGIQAAILGVKLDHLAEWNAARARNADAYDRLFAGFEPVATPKRLADRTHIFHLYVIRVAKRDELADYLRSKGIETGIHYPTALPFMPAYAYLGHQPSDFPVAYANQDRILSLPMYPELSEEQIAYVVGSVKEFFA